MLQNFPLTAFKHTPFRGHLTETNLPVLRSAAVSRSKTMRVIGTGGSADLVVVLSPVAMTLIEQVPLGGVAVTTIYGSYDGKRAFPAVMAKHVDIFGPFPQQYYGSCVLWE